MQASVCEQVRGEGALPSVAVELPPACGGPGLQFQKNAQVTLHMHKPFAVKVVMIQHWGLLLYRKSMLALLACIRCASVLTAVAPPT